MHDECGNVKANARWIAVSADIFDHPVVGIHNQKYMAAWLWLVANAAWARKVVSHKGKPIVLERGQVIVGRAFLAKEWAWTEQNVRTFLNALQRDDMLKINQSAGHFANVATICNYEKYQTPRRQDNQADNQSLTSAQPEPNQTFTKDTKDTKEEILSTVVPTNAARANETTVRSLDWNLIEQRLTAACNGALANPASAPGLLSMAVPMMWIDNGADLERDVIPTLTAAGARNHGRGIRSWDFFTGMVAEAKAKREAGLPSIATPAAPVKPPAFVPPTEAQLEAMREESRRPLREAMARKRQAQCHPQSTSSTVTAFASNEPTEAATTQPAQSAPRTDLRLVSASHVSAF